MRKTIEAIYEKGLIKPLEDITLSESQRIKVTIETTGGLVASSQALIPATADILLEVAESEEYQLYES